MRRGAVRNGPGGPGSPETYERLTRLISDRHDGMSRRFQQISRYLLQNPNAVAFASVKQVAEAAGVHSSGLVRFAQSLGFVGFKEMQAVFQTRLVTAAPGFAERVNALDEELDRHTGKTNLSFLRNLVIRDIAALRNLLETTSADRLDAAVALLEKAPRIYVIGQLRSLPVASFLRYVLAMLRREVILLDAAGGLSTEQAKIMTADCVLIAISFRYYAAEVVGIVEDASRRGVPVIAITDGPLSPIAKGARVAFDVPEDEYAFSRSLAASMCLAQTLVIGLANRLQPENKGEPVIPVATGRTDRR